MHGFNIITETKIVKDDNDSYETGKSTRPGGPTYTDDAVILQSILEYSITFGTERHFKSQDICKDHLLSNCTYYTRLYSGDNARTNTGNRVKHIEPRVSKLLEKLVALKLIKFNGQKKDYQFTKLGRLLGLLIVYKENKGNISKELYEHILVFYDSMDHSYAKLCSIFFRKIYNTPILKQMFDSLIQLLDNADDDKELFINHIERMTPILSKETWGILYDSFAELQKYESKYDILFYNFKLYLEKIHELKSQNLKAFERWRFSARYEPFIVALEGYCYSCNRYSMVKTHLINYLRSFASTTPKERANHLRVQCPNEECNNGFLDFEYIGEKKVIKEIPGATL